MATILEATTKQTGNEVRIWTADFTDDLPSGATVASGTAFHTPPGGGGTLVPTMTVSSPYVGAQLSNPADTGVHYLDIVATFSNSEKSEVRISFVVGYDDTQARAGMSSLIRRLRAMTNASPVDYEIAGVPYWSDAQLQEVLDLYRSDFYDEMLNSVPQMTSGGTVKYFRYNAPYGNLESGTNFSLALTAGGSVTASYSVDYNAGVLTFTTDQRGTAYFLTGKTYMMESAAADVWDQKAAYYSLSYDVKTDGHDLTRSQLYKQAREQATFWRGRMGAYSITAERSDTW